MSLAREVTGQITFSPQAHLNWIDHCASFIVQHPQLELVEEERVFLVGDDEVLVHASTSKGVITKTFKQPEWTWSRKHTH